VNVRVRTEVSTRIISDPEDCSKDTLCITDVIGRLQSSVYTPCSHLTTNHKSLTNEHCKTAG